MFNITQYIVYSMAEAHVFDTVVRNVRDDSTASAIAMGWLRDVLDEVDIAQVETTEEAEGTAVKFYARLSESQATKIEGASGFRYIGVS